LLIVNENINGTITSLDIGSGRQDIINKILNIVPINFEEYSKFMSSVYKFPYKNQAWRLINNNGTTNIFQVITEPSLVINNYILKYVKKPSPIILTDLSTAFSGEGLSIEGRTAAQTCELDVIIHPEILQRAVELAKSSYEGNTNSILELGKRSE